MLGLIIILPRVSVREVKKNDFDLAIQHYKHAIQCDSTMPAAHKGLGLVYFKLARKTKAKEELTRYLNLTPQAKDRAYIEQYLKEIGE